jgi:CDP-4-dehydro-6-deoxyglucose reductase, E1
MIKLVHSTFFEEYETKRALCDYIMSANKLSMGEQCEAFEKQFSKWQQTRYSVLVNSGSSANLLIVQAMLNSGLWKKGDRIGVSAVTWSTNIMPLIQLGLRPVLIDINPSSLNITPLSLSQAHERYPLKGLFVTNCLGLCPDLPAIAAYCSDNNIHLLEDNCESIGSVVSGVKSGNFGLGSTFSLFVGHHMSSIEGGIVCTDDEEFYYHLCIARAHGWTRNLPEKKALALLERYSIDTFYGQYFFIENGFNLRPTEITGFLANNQLKHLDNIIAKRQENYYFAKSLLSKSDSLIQPDEAGMDVISSFAIPLLCKTSETKTRLLARCDELGIETRPLIAGSIALQPFMAKHHWEQVNLENAEFIHKNCFYIGNHEGYSEREYSTLQEMLA